LTAHSGRLGRINSPPSDWSESYKVCGEYVTRRVILPNDQKVTTRIAKDPDAPKGIDAQSVFDYSLLRTKSKPISNFNETVYAADVFCGCGCLSLGASEACNAMGKKFVSAVAIDNSPDALAVYQRNFKPLKAYLENITKIIDGRVGSQSTINELQMQKDCFSGKRLSLLLAGPPCQGYSSLNNNRRRRDDRNILYERVARFVELSYPENVIIENVPTVLRSKERVVERTVRLMERQGYSVDSDVVNLVDIGVPQVRKRHVVVGSMKKDISIKAMIENHKVKRRRTFSWAAGDLQDEFPTSLMTIPTRHSEANKKRMEYLHWKRLYDLPNEMRPACHQKDHAYKSMYGRMRANEPAQTITSGFPSPGQGRFIHPTKLRTITPHEAARLQLIFDYFDFSEARTRRSLSSMIGNAAPMKLSYIFCIELLA